MPIALRREAFGEPDLSWLGSRRGVDTARTITLDHSKFPAAVDGIVPAGTPVEAAGNGLYQPFGSGTLAGFTLNSVRVSLGDESVALLDHGRVKTDKLPVEFTPPADPGQFVFVKEAE